MAHPHHHIHHHPHNQSPQSATITTGTTDRTLSQGHSSSYPFQPWRNNFIKTEKDQEVTKEEEEAEEGARIGAYYNGGKMDLGREQRIGSMAMSVPAAAFQPVTYHHLHHHLHHAQAASGPGVPPMAHDNNRQQVPSQLAQLRDQNPELDMKLQQCIEEGNGVEDFTKKQIRQILESISLLKPPERVLLYLRLPGANCETDPLRQPQNPLGARSEINHTINWVRSHLEPDPNVSIPKKDVYDDYTAFCARNNIKPLSTADFGKVMKQVFPAVRPRRLGTRGNSRYCYAAMRKATKLDPPMLPDLSSSVASNETSLSTSKDCSPSPAVHRTGVGQDVELNSWEVIQEWAQHLLQARFDSAQELADHIVKFNLTARAAEQQKESVGAGTSGKDTGKNKLKDKRKSLTPEKPTGSPKKRRKKRKKEDSSADGAEGTSAVGGDGGESEATSGSLPQMVKREVDSINDENQIIDLKVDRGAGGGSGPEDRLKVSKIPFKLLVNDVPMDSPSTAATDSDDLQIENIYCKKVRQAQVAKGLLYYQQQQQQQQLQTTQQQITGAVGAQSSVIVSPHTFSQPEIPSPSMLNQIRHPIVPEREGKGMAKGGGDGGSEDAITRDLFLPRERVISLCALDKDALDDYLKASGDISQEAGIMECFDENSSNGQSTVGTEESSPKVEDGSGGAAGVVAPVGHEGNAEAYGGIFGPVKGFHDGQDKLSQLRHMLHNNIPPHHQQQAAQQQQQSGTRAHNGFVLGYSASGSASASLSMLSQRQSGSTPLAFGQQSESVGMDLTQGLTMHGGAEIAGRPVSLKKRRLPLNEESPETGQRRFVPIVTPPQSLSGGNFAKISPNLSRHGDFLSPKVQATQQEMKPRQSPAASPLALVLHHDNMSLSDLFEQPSPSGQKFYFGTAAAGGAPHEGTTYRRGEVKALNMSSSFDESRCQSVPLNYRQSPMHVTSPNDGSSWSSFHAANNANHSACSSMAATPIPANFSDFTEMNIFENDRGSQDPQFNRSVKDKNNNNNNNNGDDFVEEMKSFNALASGITSRSVPSTPVPGSMPYYPKTYLNGSMAGNQLMFGNYGQQQTMQQPLQRSFDVSKSVPTTPIVSQQFRYSPVAELQHRRDILINGNANLDKALTTAGGYEGHYGESIGSDSRGGCERAGGPGSDCARRRIEKIEEDRKGITGPMGKEMGEERLAESEEDAGMGYETLIDPDLMNEFKDAF